MSSEDIQNIKHQLLSKITKKNILDAQSNFTVMPTFNGNSLITANSVSTLIEESSNTLIYTVENLNSNFTVPDNVTTMKAVIIGAGGNGGNGGEGGGGGGASGAILNLYLTVTSGTTFGIVVGDSSLTYDLNTRSSSLTIDSKTYIATAGGDGQNGSNNGNGTGNGYGGAGGSNSGTTGGAGGYGYTNGNNNGTDGAISSFTSVPNSWLSIFGGSGGGGAGYATINTTSIKTAGNGAGDIFNTIAGGTRGSDSNYHSILGTTVQYGAGGGGAGGGIGGGVGGNGGSNGSNGINGGNGKIGCGGGGGGGGGADGTGGGIGGRGGNGCIILNFY